MSVLDVLLHGSHPTTPQHLPGAGYGRIVRFDEAVARSIALGHAWDRFINRIGPEGLVVDLELQDLERPGSPVREPASLGVRAGGGDGVRR